jgi:hypothetical protein
VKWMVSNDVELTDAESYLKCGPLVGSLLGDRHDGGGAGPSVVGDGLSMRSVDDELPTVGY